MLKLSVSWSIRKRLASVSQITECCWIKAFFLKGNKSGCSTVVRLRWTVFNYIASRHMNCLPYIMHPECFCTEDIIWMLSIKFSIQVHLFKLSKIYVIFTIYTFLAYFSNDPSVQRTHLEVWFCTSVHCAVLCIHR